MLGGAILGHLDDDAPHLEVAQRLARVEAKERHPRVAAHVPLLGEAAHRVEADALAVEVAPDDRCLRVAVLGDSRQGDDRRPLHEVVVRCGDRVASVVANQPDRSHQALLSGADEALG